MNLKHLNFDGIYFVGDIHGEFNPFIFNTQKFNNSLFILAGDVGFGFYKSNYYLDTIHFINQKLRKNNNHIIAIRGNHDNPLWFNTEFLENIQFNYSNWINVPDYTVIETNQANILCIGGAHSVDRKSRIKDVDWWENETVVELSTEMLKNINQYDINTIVSHSSPNICYPLTKEGLLRWGKLDDKIVKDCDLERSILFNIYEKLCNYHKIENWYYGHYHKSYFLTYENEYTNQVTKFHGLNCHEIKEYRNYENH